MIITNIHLSALLVNYREQIVTITVVLMMLQLRVTLAFLLALASLTLSVAQPDPIGPVGKGGDGPSVVEEAKTGTW